MTQQILKDCSGKTWYSAGGTTQSVNEVEGETFSLSLSLSQQTSFFAVVVMLLNASSAASLAFSA